MMRHSDSSFQTMITHKIALVLNKYACLIKIIPEVDSAGGRIFLVGGAVRDMILGKLIKDVDIEIHGLYPEQIETILSQYGQVNRVGKSFGVLRIEGIDIDWSLPRLDSSGRKPEVTIDPHLSLKQAFMRRDLTINAMGIDLLTYECIDFFGGIKDIQDRVLRVVDPVFFCQDPLRFYRVMQFIGRFEMEPDSLLTQICTTMDISTVSIERIEKECEKLLLKSQRPSLAFRWLHKIGRLKEVIPEVALLDGVPQNSEWHPEGDVFEHSMQALDASAFLVYNDMQTKLIMMYAALLHDIGKKETTKQIGGVWRSLRHEHVGALMVPAALRRITRKKDLISAVKCLVKYHMVPMQLVKSKASKSAYKRLACKVDLCGITLSMLADLCLADKQGRNGLSHIPLTSSFSDLDYFRNCIEKLGIAVAAEKPVLQGSDLLKYVAPGPKIGKMLAYAYTIQLQEGIVDKDILEKRVVSFFKKNKKIE